MQFWKTLDNPGTLEGFLRRSGKLPAALIMSQIRCTAGSQGLVPFSAPPWP